MKSIVIGTAGHIDHGKTALVRALTGIDADRLPEEKRRGITIDIGFADLDLGDVQVGFVDVPGHERFVKNMLAGAHGIDVVALVIAADEGVMPQTREHFEICRLLDVPQGLIVLTKKDLIEEDLLALVRAEVKELVARSFLEGAPIVAVSSRTGEGLEELREIMREVALRVAARPNELITRMPIDRAFSMSGFGAVVTGTLVAGEIKEGDELELLPGIVRARGRERAPSLTVGFRPKSVRVRGVQVHGAKVKQAVASQRTAVNLGGVETAELERGMVLAKAGKLRLSRLVDANVQILDDAPRALRSRQRVRLHLGAAEVLGRVRVLNADGVVQPGASGFAQLSLEAPVASVLGDRFIVRSYSPQRTIGGGVILDAFANKQRGPALVATRERLATLLEGTPEQKLAALVSGATAHGLSRPDLVARTGWRDEVAAEQIEMARAAGLIVEIAGQLLIPGVLEKLKQTVVSDVEGFHQSEPLSRGLPLEVLRGRHFAHGPADLFRGLLTALEKAGLVLIEKDVVRRPEHTRAVAGVDAQIRDRLEAVYREATLAPPALNEAFARAGLNASAQQHGRKVLQVLIDAGSVVRVDGEMFFHRAALDELKAKLRAHAAKEQSIDVPGFKELAGITRKYAIPLLEYLDRERVTRREGDRRVIL